MLLEMNGKFSSSKRTKHINNKYFLISDKIAQGDLKLEYYPTDKMWADGHTKPKQGLPFKQDRGMTMNFHVDYFEDESKHEDFDAVGGIQKPDSYAFVKKMETGSQSNSKRLRESTLLLQKHLGGMYV